MSPRLEMAVLPLIFGWPLVLYPAHVLFLEFLIDPACSVAFEAEPTARDAMRRPPRRRDAKLFSAHTLGAGMLQGLVVLIGVVAIYGAALAVAASEREARTIAFGGIANREHRLILSNRSRELPIWTGLKTHNIAMWIIIAGALAGLAAVIMIPPIRDLFRFEAISAQNRRALFAVFLPGAGAVIVAEFLKSLRFRHAAIDG